MDFDSMKRKELQALCKKHSIPANLTNLEMANKLTLLLKQKEKPAIRGRSCLKNLDESENGSKVATRKLKKVRFSPKNEMIEFVDFEMDGDGAMRKTGGRRSKKKRDLVIQNDVNAEPLEEVRDNPIRITRSRVQRFMEGDAVIDLLSPGEKKKVRRGGRTEAKSVGRSDKPPAGVEFDGGVGFRRQLRSREVVGKDLREGEDGDVLRKQSLKKRQNAQGNDGDEISEPKKVLRQSKRNAKDSALLSGESGKIEMAKRITRSRTEFTGIASVIHSETGIGNKVEVGEESETVHRLKEPSRCRQRKSVAPQSVKVRSNEPPGEGEDGDVSRKRSLKKRQNAQGNDGDEISKPEKVLRRSKPNAKDSALLSGESGKTEMAKRITRSRTEFAGIASVIDSETGIGNEVEVEESETVHQREEPSRSRRRKSVVPQSVKVRSNEPLVENKNRTLPRNPILEEGGSEVEPSVELSKENEEVSCPIGPLRRSHHNTSTLKSIAPSDGEFGTHDTVGRNEPLKLLSEAFPEKEAPVAEEHLRRSSRNASRRDLIATLSVMDEISHAIGKKESQKRKRDPILEEEICETECAALIEEPPRRSKRNASKRDSIAPPRVTNKVIGKKNPQSRSRVLHLEVEASLTKTVSAIEEPQIVDAELSAPERKASGIISEDMSSCEHTLSKGNDESGKAKNPNPNEEVETSSYETEMVDGTTSGSDTLVSDVGAGMFSQKAQEVVGAKENEHDGTVSIESASTTVGEGITDEDSDIGNKMSSSKPSHSIVNDMQEQERNQLTVQFTVTVNNSSPIENEDITCHETNDWVLDESTCKVADVVEEETKAASVKKYFDCEDGKEVVKEGMEAESLPQFALHEFEDSKEDGIANGKDILFDALSQHTSGDCRGERIATYDVTFDSKGSKVFVEKEGIALSSPMLSKKPNDHQEEVAEMNCCADIVGDVPSSICNSVTEGKVNSKGLERDADVEHGYLVAEVNAEFLPKLGLRNHDDSKELTTQVNSSADAGLVETICRDDEVSGERTTVELIKSTPESIKGIDMLKEEENGGTLLRFDPMGLGQEVLDHRDDFAMNINAPGLSGEIIREDGEASEEISDEVAKKKSILAVMEADFDCKDTSKDVFMAVKNGIIPKLDEVKINDFDGPKEEVVPELEKCAVSISDKFISVDNKDDEDSEEISNEVKGTTPQFDEVKFVDFDGYKEDVVLELEKSYSITSDELISADCEVVGIMLQHDGVKLGDFDGHKQEMVPELDNSAFIASDELINANHEDGKDSEKMLDEVAGIGLQLDEAKFIDFDSFKVEVVPELNKGALIASDALISTDGEGGRESEVKSDEAAGTTPQLDEDSEEMSNEVAGTTLQFDEVDGDKEDGEDSQEISAEVVGFMLQHDEVKLGDFDSHKLEMVPELNKSALITSDELIYANHEDGEDSEKMLDEVAGIKLQPDEAKFVDFDSFKVEVVPELNKGTLIASDELISTDGEDGRESEVKSDEAAGTMPQLDEVKISDFDGHKEEVVPELDKSAFSIPDKFISTYSEDDEDSEEISNEVAGTAPQFDEVKFVDFDGQKEDGEDSQEISDEVEGITLQHDEVKLGDFDSHKQEMVPELDKSAFIASDELIYANHEEGEDSEEILDEVAGIRLQLDEAKFVDFDSFKVEVVPELNKGALIASDELISTDGEDGRESEVKSDEAAGTMPQLDKVKISDFDGHKEEMVPELDKSAFIESDESISTDGEAPGTKENFGIMEGNLNMEDNNSDAKKEEHVESLLQVVTLEDFGNHLEKQEVADVNDSDHSFLLDRVFENCGVAADKADVEILDKKNGYEDIQDGTKWVTEVQASPQRFDDGNKWDLRNSAEVEYLADTSCSKLEMVSNSATLSLLNVSSCHGEEYESHLYGRDICVDGTAKQMTEVVLDDISLASVEFYEDGGNAPTFMDKPFHEDNEVTKKKDVGDMNGNRSFNDAKDGSNVEENAITSQEVAQEQLGEHEDAAAEAAFIAGIDCLASNKTSRDNEIKSVAEETEEARGTSHNIDEMVVCAFDSMEYAEFGNLSEASLLKPEVHINRAAVSPVSASANHENGRSELNVESCMFSSWELNLILGNGEGDEAEKSNVGASETNFISKDSEDAGEVKENVIIMQQVAEEQLAKHEHHMAEEIAELNGTLLAVSDEPICEDSEGLKEQKDMVITIKENIDCKNHRNQSTEVENSRVNTDNEILTDVAEMNDCEHAALDEPMAEGNSKDSKEVENIAITGVEYIKSSAERGKCEEIGVGTELSEAISKQSPAFIDSAVDGGLAAEDAQMWRPNAESIQWKNPNEKIEESISFSTEQLISSMTKMKNIRTSWIQRTPKKLLKTLDMKENTPSIKRELMGNMTTVKSVSKRRALKDLHNH